MTARRPESASDSESHSEVGWSRSGQDAAEAEFPPPEEPQDEPKLRSISTGRLALLLVADIIAVFVLLVFAYWVGVSLGGRTFHSTIQAVIALVGFVGLIVLNLKAAARW